MRTNGFEPDEHHTVLRRYASKSKPGLKHEVRLSADRKDVYCTCPAWRFSQASPKCCKHVVAHFAAVRAAVVPRAA